MSSSLIALWAAAGCAVGSAEPGYFAGARATTGPIKVGQPAPDFSAKGSDGKTYTLKQLTEKGPLFLYFVKDMCSANPYAVKHFNAMYAAYGANVKFVAVINCGADGYAEWKNQFKAPYLTLLDPAMKIIDAYGLRNSQHTFMIDQTQTVAKYFPGFGQATLKSLNQALAETAKADVAKIDFSSAPDQTVYG